MVSAVSEMFQLLHFAQLSGIFGAAQCQGALAFVRRSLISRLVLSNIIDPRNLTYYLEGVDL